MINVYGFLRRTAVTILCVSFLAVTVILGGCSGGGRSGTTPSGKGRGGVRVSLNWPAPSRFVPAAANSVVVVATSPDGKTLSADSMERPPDGGVTTAVLNRIPVGTVNVTASAYPEPFGVGVAQATATATVEIHSGVNAALALTMASTVQSLVVTPAEWKTGMGVKKTFTATGRNAANEVVLLSASRLTWRSGDESVVTVDDTGEARAVGAGTTTITVHDTESGFTVEAPVTVGQPISEPYRILALKNEDVAYNAINGKLYVTRPVSEGAEGNSLVTVEPATGAVSEPVFIGSGPGTMAISDDGKFIYIGLRGAKKIVRFNTETNAIDQRFDLSIPTANLNDSFYAKHIVVQPGRPNVIVVSGFNYDSFLGGETLGPTAVFENGMPRPKTVASQGGPVELTWGGSPERVYGLNDVFLNNYVFLKMAVDDSGIVIEDSSDESQGGIVISKDMTFAGGRLFGANGRIIDPEAFLTLGTCEVNGAVAPDVERNRAFYAQSADDSNFTIVACDLASFHNVGELAVSDLPRDSYDKMARWGDKGLVLSSRDNIVLIPTAPGL